MANITANQIVTMVVERFSNGAILHAAKLSWGQTMTRCGREVRTSRWELPPAFPATWYEAVDLDLARCPICEMKLAARAARQAGEG